VEDERIQRVVEDILREGRRKADEIVERAKKEAEMILNSARIRAEEEKQTKIREAEESGRVLKERTVSEAGMRARMDFLAGREKIVDGIMERVLRKFEEIGETSEYRGWLFDSAVRACFSIGAERVVLRANERDARFLKTKLEEIAKKSGKRVAIGEPIRTVGGVRVESGDGDVSVDETIESVVRRNTERIRKRIIELISEEG
jgi:V/A-type H+-transporting ATPase subunit E